MCGWQGLDKEGIEETASKILGVSGDVLIDSLPGDASTRRFYRVAIEGDHKSLVLMRLEKPLINGELPFINIHRYLVKCGVGIPRVYLYEQEKGILFLEDLGDQTLEKKVMVEAPEAIQGLYKEVVDTLIHLQSATSKNPDPDCVAYHRIFDVEKLMQELDMFLEYVPGLYKRKIKEVDRKAIRDEFYSLCSFIAKQDRVFTHRDYHSRNLLIHEGKIKLVDFQDGRLGPAQYDLASLLFDSYVVLDDAMREDLFSYYLEKIGHGVDEEKFRMVFDYTSIQRNLKACGTFAYLNFEKGKDSYTKYIPNTLRYANKNFSKYPELKELKKVLSKYFEEI